MMASFSERYGYTKPRDTIQLECMDDNLRIGIYNMLYGLFGDYQHGSSAEDLWRDVWSEFWRKPLDEFPNYYPTLYNGLKHWILTCAWYEPYDLLECIGAKSDELFSLNDDVSGIPWHSSSYGPEIPSFLEDYREIVNELLRREGSGYRMVGLHVVPITNDAELSALEQAIDPSPDFKTAHDHLSRALSLFAKRPDPDYANTVKEAISAVEAAAQVVSGDSKASLGDALAIISKDGTSMHPALIKGWKKLYGFTCDAGGIRHAEHPDDVPIDGPFAKYMLVSCSAFVNYLVEASMQASSAIDTDYTGEMPWTL